MFYIWRIYYIKGDNDHRIISFIGNAKNFLYNGTYNVEQFHLRLYGIGYTYRLV